MQPYSPIRSLLLCNLVIQFALSVLGLSAIRKPLSRWFHRGSASQDRSAQPRMSTIHPTIFSGQFSLSVRQSGLFFVESNVNHLIPVRAVSLQGLGTRPVVSHVQQNTVHIYLALTNSFINVRREKSMICLENFVSIHVTWVGWSSRSQLSV